MEYCNECPNQCPKNDLKCGRGEAYFNGGNGNRSMHKGHGTVEIKSNNELVRLLAICGKVAEHKSEKMIEHNMDESAMFDVLSDRQQSELKLLLEKLNKQWKAEHERHHKH